MKREVIGPDECKKIIPSLKDPAWIYKYTHPSEKWTLSIATEAGPNSQKLSLGGFRIAPESRVSLPDYNNDREALGLAIGMTEKVYWSRLCSVGGPLGIRNLGRITGGKCVLFPTPGARIGEPRDKEIMDFAIEALRDAEKTGGFFIVTGQDLGHGKMSTGSSTSLQYGHERFHGYVLADTSKPTGAGNYHILKGMLKACNIAMEKARIGFIGCGNVGRYALEEARKAGAQVFGLEPTDSTRKALKEEGVETWGPSDKMKFLNFPLDAVVCNANGGTLDPSSIDALCRNTDVKIICGSENLVMPDPTGETRLQQAKKLYAHTELGGMMGYLTAVEEYLSHIEKKTYDVKAMFAAAGKLDEIGEKASRYAITRNFDISFNQAVKDIYGDEDE